VDLHYLGVPIEGEKGDRIGPCHNKKTHRYRRVSGPDDLRGLRRAYAFITLYMVMSVLSILAEMKF
jgi:hypothetical protein